MEEKQSNQTAVTAAEAERIPNTPLQFLLRTIRPYWLMASVGVLAVVVGQVISAGMSVFIGRFVDVVNQTQDVETYATWGAIFVVLNVVLFIAIRVS